MTLVSHSITVFFVAALLLGTAQWTDAVATTDSNKKTKGLRGVGKESSDQDSTKRENTNALRRRRRVLKSSGKDLCMYDPVQHPMDEVDCPTGSAAVFNHDDCAWECKDVQQQQPQPQPQTRSAAPPPPPPGYYAEQAAQANTHHYTQGAATASAATSPVILPVIPPPSSPQTRSASSAAAAAAAASPVILPAIPPPSAFQKSSQSAATSPVILPAIPSPPSSSSSAGNHVVQPTLRLPDVELECPSGYLLIWNASKGDYECIHPQDIECPQGQSVIYNEVDKQIHCGV